jgi:flotillin
MKTTLRPMKRFGLVTATPTEYLVLQRLGRLRFPGRGAAAWVVPGLDRAFLIPSSVQSAAFLADQITVENQGVEIGGFALWSVADPARAVEAVDFTDSDAGLARIGEQLRAVVEAAIRREVANLTLEQVLRQRAAMTHLLDDELAKVAERWGLAIAAIEIKSVQVLSKQLFENMQAKFRDTQRLASARSAMETDEAIARARAADRETAAERDLAFRVAEIARDEEALRQEIARDQRLEEAKETARREREIARLDSDLALVRAREEHQRDALAANEALIGIEESLEVRRHQTERLRGEQRDRLAVIDDAITRRGIETANLKDRGRLLVEALPDVVAGLNVGTVNLGDPPLVAGVQSLIHLFAGTGSVPK